MSTFFIRQGTDAVENASELLDLIINQLQDKSEALADEYSSLGKGFQDTVQPWALVFCKDIEPIEKMFKQKLDEENAESQAEQRRWLDLIRICRVETTHQLRAVLCGIHIEPSTEEESVDILRWIYEHKDGQPPTMVIVVDLFGIMLSNQSDNEYSETLRYLTIDFNELSHILLNLVETNAFLSKRGQKRWQNVTMEPVVMETQLIITDRGRIPHEESVAETNQRTSSKKSTWGRIASERLLKKKKILYQKVPIKLKDDLLN